MYFLDWFSKKYAAPGSNIVFDSSPLTPGDGKCNQFNNPGSCGGTPTESCYNDPADCGPCPTIANISDINIASSKCNPLMCTNGVCAPGACGDTLTCSYNCDSAHYGGTGEALTTESDAVDFVANAVTCPGLATLSDILCNNPGSNYISYAQDAGAGTLHVSINTLSNNFHAVPDDPQLPGFIPPTACPSPNGGPPSFRAWLAGFAINNTLFTIGGGICNGCAGFGGSEVPTVETYDTSSGAWYAKRPLQTARFGLSTTAVNGKVYAIGGTSGSGSQSLPIPTVEEYDPGTDLWSTKTTMPTPRWKLTSSTVNGIIYTIGGGATGNQCVPTGAVEAYDPVGNSWTTTKKPLPTARWGAASDVLNGQIYVAGGSQSCPQGSVIVSFELEVYDPSADAWTSKMPMPTARWDLAAAAVNGKFYAIGGWDPINQTALDVVEEFDPGTNSWTTKFHMPTKRSGLTAVAINGKIYAFGGINQFNQLLATLEIYDPATDKWTTAPPPPTNPPSITLISPVSRTQGTTIPNFTVDGSNFDSAAKLSFNSGNGIVINSQSVIGTTQITANLTITPDAPIGAQDVIVTNSDGQKSTLGGAFTIQSSRFLLFPLHNKKTAFTAKISAVMDHNIPLDTDGNPLFYSRNGYVDVFTGDEGTANCSAAPPCTEPGAEKKGIFGYKNNSGTSFSLKLPNYTGGSGCAMPCSNWLFYDGHTGFDYPSILGTDVYAPAGGVAFIPDCDPVSWRLDCSSSSPGSAVDGFNILAVDHGNGYSTWYLHMGDLKAVKNESATIPGSPFQVTVANATEFQADQKVVYSATLKKLIRVPSNPSAGHYSVDASNGVYTFAAADSGKGVLISYSFAADFRVIACPGQQPIALHRGDGQRISVTTDCKIGKTGNKALNSAGVPFALSPHLHFEVRRGLTAKSDGSYQCLLPICHPVDPYGWTGDPGKDPYPLQLGPNVLLWK